MATQNKIIAAGLESRAIDLFSSGKTLREIASILSTDSKTDISYSSVKRFFDTCETTKVIEIEKSDQLKATIVEAEINTVQWCTQCIEDLQAICKDAKEAGDRRTAILAIDKIYVGLDMLNKIWGKYQLAPQHTFNNSDVQINLQMIDCSKRGD